jgi:serine/threonine protein phosphatase 1
VRHLAIGDIHGCAAALTTLAATVPFRDDDLVITLGDYVDRGPDSYAVLDWLIARKRRGNLITLRGNHEIIMLNAREDPNTLDDWLHVGGDATLASYSHFDDEGRLADVPDEHWAFLESGLLPYYEIDTHFFVHANAFAEMPLTDQPDFMLYWEGWNDPPPHLSGKIMVCGHTAQRSGLPLNVGHAICIDTRAYGRDGWLTCLDVGSGRYWQANQRRETRVGWLDEIEA